MRKRDIEELAKRKRQQQAAQTIAPKAANPPQERAEHGGCGHCRGDGSVRCEAISGAFTDIRVLVREEVREALLELGPILARLAAADTRHTSERPETVFRYAINEGLLARDMVEGLESHGKD